MNGENLPYQTLDVVPFTPITSEWGDGVGDDIFALAAGTGLDDGSVTAGKLDPSTGYVHLKGTTLQSAGNTMTISDLPVRRNLLVVITTGATGGNIRTRMRFNNDTGNNYAIAAETPGSADATAGDLDSITIDSTAHNNPSLAAWVRISNVAAQEKVTQSECIRTASGASNVPTRNTRAGKWANTATSITRIDVFNSEAGTYVAGSRMDVFGQE